MKRLGKIGNDIQRLCLYGILSLAALSSYSQCIIQCNTNAGVYSNNDPKTIAYDNMGSSFHSTFAAQPTGYIVWGEDIANAGNANHLSPAFINSTNYPALTGKLYLVGLGSFGLNRVQLIVLTSTGLFAGGRPGAVLSTSIKASNVFAKLTINGKTDGLPTGITPDSVKMLFVTDWSIIITTCGGRVFVLSQDVNIRGNGGGGSATAWSQVMQSAGVPLTGIIAARGASTVGFALKSDSTIWTWGDNVVLGNGSTASNLNYASQMTVPTGIGGIKMIQATLNYWASTPAVSYYLLGTDKKVYSLGANNVGQLGDRTTTIRLVWVNALNTNSSVINDALWISANEHDPIYPNLGVLKSNGNMLTCGNNNTFMVGRSTNNNTNHLDFPSGISSTDTILYCEIGGHTSAYIKYNNQRYGYVGHHRNGSIGNNNGADSTITSVNFAIPPVISVCGTVCDTPKIYAKPFFCNDTVLYFVIKSKSGNKVKYQLNSNPADSVIIGITDSVIIAVNNTASNQTLKILKVENIACNLSVNVSDTLKYTTRKDSFRNICLGQSILFNGIVRANSGIYRDTFINARGCDSFLILNLTVNDTTRKDSLRTICRYQPITFNGQTLNTAGVYKDTLVNAKGCDSFLYLILTVNDTSRKDSFRTICKNQSVVFNGNTLNNSGVYRYTLVNAKGCDSFLVLNLTVNDTTRKDSVLTICKNKPIVFNGQTLNTSGVYRDTFVNSKGCDSFLYLILTVNDTTKKDSFRTICKNQSVVFNGNILNTSGMYRDTLVNSKGCDSFVYLHLSISDTSKKDSFLSICRYQPITFNGQTLNITGVYKDTLVNSSACDSFLYLHLTVNDTSRKDSFRTICKNQSLVFNGNTLNNSGVYRDTLVNAKGCDSFLVLNLTVNDTTRKDSVLTICKNKPIVFNGQTLNTSGVYKDTFVNAKGCDSILYLILTVNDTTKKDSFRTICKNQSVVFNGNILNTSGTYRDTLVNSKGCDSFVYLYLTVNDTTRKDSFHSICRYQPIIFNGQTLNTSGVYKDTLTNAKGCDSFLYLILTVNDTSRKDSFRTICKNQFVVFNGNTLNTSGVYRDTMVNAKGCDSFLVLNLTVNDTTKKDSLLTICKNKPIVFNGQSLNTSGVYRDTFVNAKGCDSILYLILTVNDTTKKDSFRTICKNQSVVFNGNTLNTSGTYRDTLVNAKGCDSFVYLHLSISDTSKKDSFLSICRYQPINFNGQSLNIAGIYKDTLVNAKGCDSFLYLILTVNDTSRKDSFRTICKNQFVLFNGNTLNTSGVYRDTTVNAKGCDSFLVLNLTVNDTTKKDSLLTICKNKPIVFNGQTLNTSGVYKDTFVNAKGCDSILYLILTVNDTTKKDSFRTICKNQSVVFNGNTLNTSGTYRDTLVNAKGCDSFVYLHLSISDTSKKDSFLSICRYQPINFNGQSLNIAGIYKDTLVNAKGCDSFLYLILTVNDTSRKDSFRTICKNQFVVFNGNTLNTSGVYRDTLVNAKGCDSFLYLHLTVNDTTRKDSFRTICKNQPIAFNGNTINVSGTYKDTLVNAKGCDSFLYLYLTVNDTTRKDSFRTICKNQSVTFNGNTINTSGTYKDTLINSKGCDSFLYLYLTVKDTTRKDSFRTICRYQPINFNGQSLNIAGIYKDTLVNSGGCDSFLYLHLTVNDTTRKDSFRTICKNQFVTFNGNTINSSGIFKDTLVNAKGCDSFLYLHLTVNDTTRKDSFRTICKNQPIAFNGNTINVSGTYKDTLVNAKGCDSFLYLYLTVNDTTRKDSFRTICKNQSVTFNGNTINTSGTYKDTFINGKGCDSFLYFHLNVLDTTNYFFTINICQGDSFPFNQIVRKTQGGFKDTLVNASGCDSFIYLNLIVNPLPTANAGADATRVNCIGDSILLGSISIPNHSYNWTPNLFLSNPAIAQPWSKATTPTTYYLTLTNNLTGCTNNDTVVISIKNNDLISDAVLEHIKCNANRTGEIHLLAKRGNPNYKYKLSQTIYQDSGIFKNLPAGPDQFTVKDSKGCLFSDTFTISEPPALKIDTIKRKNLRCYQSRDGEIRLVVSGGTPGFEYSWSRSNQDSFYIKGLEAGDHEVTITDSNKCTISDMINLTEPTPIKIKDTFFKPNPCFGDSLASIEVVIKGGTSPYKYIWDNGKTTNKITNLKQDTFVLKVIDTSNCIDSFKISIKDIDPLKFDSISPIELNCEDYGQIVLNAKGGKKNYLYSIDSGSNFSINNKFRISQPILYHVQVKDANNCLAKDTIRVKGAERIEIRIYPKDTMVGIGDPVRLSFEYLKGDPAKVQSYIWKPTEGLSCTDCPHPIASPFVPMLYSVILTYNGNCYESDTARITHNLDDIFIPNTFSPSSPNIENQTFRIYSNHIFKARLNIFNRWGEKVFESDQAHKTGWDGTYKGEYLKYDVFTYWAEIIFLDGRKVFKAGDVTLLR